MRLSTWDWKTIHIPNGWLRNPAHQKGGWKPVNSRKVQDFATIHSRLQKNVEDYLTFFLRMLYLSTIYGKFRRILPQRCYRPNGFDPDFRPCTRARQTAYTWPTIALHISIHPYIALHYITLCVYIYIYMYVICIFIYNMYIHT